MLNGSEMRDTVVTGVIVVVSAACTVGCLCGGLVTLAIEHFRR